MGTPISQLRDVTCHMGLHSVTCHPTQVNAPRRKSSGRRSDSAADAESVQDPAAGANNVTTAAIKERSQVK